MCTHETQTLTYAIKNTELNKAKKPQFHASTTDGAAALELAALALGLVPVAEGVPDGLADEVGLVEFNSSSGTMTASRTCIRPLCVLDFMSAKHHSSSLKPESGPSVNLQHVCVENLRIVEI